MTTRYLFAPGVITSPRGRRHRAHRAARLGLWLAVAALCSLLGGLL